METVVRIATGEIMEAVLTPGKYECLKVWLPSQLKKDGTPNLTKLAAGTIEDRPLSFYSSTWFALFNPEREARAQPIRDQIKALQDQVNLVQKELMAVYDPPVEAKEA